MSEIDKFFEWGNCSHKGCAESSLPLSQPPACWVHIASIDDWYESYLDAARRATDDPFQLAPLLVTGSSLHNRALVKSGAAQELHDEFEKRKVAGSGRRFLFADIVFFICTAAASGVIGGLSLEAIKRLIARIVADSNPQEVHRLVDEILPEAKFEELRNNRKEEIIVETEQVIEQRLKRTYRLTVRKSKTDQ
ncbi:hypothetical protein ES703_124113 [subsurface metagenome]